ncbi:hypothetical protein OIDMADRAFT_164812 [Oidiodendron maius Zn]|uniref:tripeptidyl-peptidase II n=1 Tax=Oidiodendron maius (strain Zn) TaxID=913774 RepID=A0A0C3HDH9_OIDMZ|nr:hypothetical protein OIDMADRAFT_164812 [Oidiodendron maius Zn]
MYILSLGLLLSAALAAQAISIPVRADHVVHERRGYVPDAWVKRDRLDPAATLPVRIGMTQQNLDKGYNLLLEVSRHDSPRYGQYYSAEEVAEIFAPSQATVDSVRGWLLSAGIEAESISQSVNKQWMQFDISTADLESLLSTQYHVYEHAVTGKSTVACDKYHVPAHIQEHVDYITPGIKLFAPNQKESGEMDVDKRTFGVTSQKGKAGFSPPLSRPLDIPILELLSLLGLSTCDQYITPQCVATLYNVTAPSKAAAGNELGIFESLGDYLSQTDLDLFYLSLAPNIPVGTGPTVHGIDGGTIPAGASAGPESDLDFQIAYPLIYPQNTILFQTDDQVYEANYTFQGFLNTFLDALDGSYCSSINPLDPPYPDPQPGGYTGSLQCGVYKPTNVISISYGGQESDLPAAYQQRQCNEFLKLGMQGVSIVLASGDSGVGGPNGCIGSGNIFSPDFPATCPYITTVGATYLPSGASAATDSEVAVSRFGSGGGFSNIYPVPSYQSEAVEAYLANSPPQYPSYSGTDDQNIGANGGVWNSAGRGYPDVSAVGDNIVIYNNLLPTIIGGTSASAPVFASILNRINEERLAANKSTVGFVNPVLYANPQILHDITAGTNPGCNTSGFSASTGWDPVTGLGTPDYPKMLELFLGLD